MPVRDRRPEDEKPLFRAVNEQRLMGPVGAGTGERKTSESAGTRIPPAGDAGPEEKGPIARAFDRAEQNNWLYPSVANAARENGLLDKADELLNRVRSQLGAG